MERGELKLAPSTDKLVEPPRKIDTALSDAEAFQEAMAEVRPLGWSQTPIRLPRPVALREADDQEEALRELREYVEGHGALDPFATGEGVEGAATRRGRVYLRRLKSGEFSIQAHLDLHGLDLVSARQSIGAFIVDSIRLGHTCVRIIHGRGKHSRGEQAVLKARVIQWLSSRRMSRYVAAFASARRQDGGGGALYVLLYTRQPPQRS